MERLWKYSLYSKQLDTEESIYLGSAFFGNDRDKDKITLELMERFWPYDSEGLLGTYADRIIPLVVEDDKEEQQQ